MPRRYTIPFDDILVSTPVDLVSVVPDFVTFPSAFARLLRAWVMCTDTTLPTAQQLRLQIIRLEAIVAGSGGAAQGPLADDTGDGATHYDGRVCDIVLATGTPDIFYDLACYLYTGLDWVASDPPPCNGAAGFAFRLLSTPSTPIRLSGGVLFEESGSGV